MKVDPDELYTTEEVAAMLFGGDPPRNLSAQLRRNGIVPLRLRKGRRWLELWPGRGLLSPTAPSNHAGPDAPPVAKADLNFNWV